MIDQLEKSKVKLSMCNNKKDELEKPQDQLMDPIIFMQELAEYPKKYERPHYDTYFMNMAFMVATRSTCFRRNVGAVIVKDQRILSTGYNGAPRQVRNCLQLGFCIRMERNVPSGEQHEICRGAHAEQNAIANAAYSGVAIKGATIYITENPCSICTKMLMNCGIKKIVFVRKYIDDLSMEMLRESDIEIKKFTKIKTIEEFDTNNSN